MTDDVHSIFHFCRVLRHQAHKKLWLYAGSMPLGWYLLMMLIVPLLNGAYRGNERQFIEHTAFVLAASLVMLLIGFVAAKTRRHEEK